MNETPPGPRKGARRVVEELLDDAGLEGPDRREVREELLSHFEDALAAGSSLREAVEEFGASAEVARMLARSRKRLKRSEKRESLAGEVARMGGRIVVELEQALRRMRRRPGFSLMALVTLGVALGACTAIFALVDGVLLEPLPYPEPERLVQIEHSAPAWGYPELPATSDGFYVHYRTAETFSQMALYRWTEVNLGGGATPATRVRAVSATPGLLDLLGATPALGRPLPDQEGEPAGPPSLLLTWSLWQSRFGADPGVVGRTIQVDGIAREVLGVLPREFDFPGDDPEILLPLLIFESRASTGRLAFQSLGRLAPDVEPEAARAELQAIIPRALEVQPGLDPEFVRQSGLDVVLRPLRDKVVREIRAVLWILLAAVGVLLAVACVNLTNLFLVRMEERRTEIAVRSALGASRGDLRGTLLAEGLLVSVGAAGLGVLLAAGALELLQGGSVDTIPRLNAVDVDASVLAFCGGLSLACGLLVGGLPALPVMGSLADILRAAGRAATSARGVVRARRLLVGGQVALALVLVVGSGLMARTALSLSRVDPGFDPDGLLTFDISLPGPSYPEYDRVLEFHGELRTRLAELPNVTSVTLAEGFPVRSPGVGRGIALEGVEGEGQVAEGGIMSTRVVSLDFFETLGIPILEGRSFRPEDLEGTGRAVVVSQSFARRRWPEGAVGRRLHTDDSDGWLRVVGVAGDTRDEGLTHPATEMVYLPLAQDDPWGSARTATFAVRSALPTGELLGRIRSLVERRDPTVPVARVETAERILARDRSRVSLTLALLGAAAGGALLLGVVGIFGMVSYATARRARELGIRVALGADRWTIRRLVLKEGGGMVLPGTVLGLAAAALGTRFLGSLLFGVDPLDPVTYALAAATVSATALLAAWLPARRAEQVDPALVLREE